MPSTPSPTKRSALSPKVFNVNPLSPQRKSIASVTREYSKSPFRSVSEVRTPSPKKHKAAAAPGFTIWEDKVDNSSHSIVGTPISNKLNHNDQENILQPKITCIRSGPRSPLGDLSINSFKGFVTSNGVTTQLDELFQPATFENEFRSTHRFNNLPSFATPVKKDKYLAKSGQKSGYEIAAIKKHKRSYSAGTNVAKRDLIQKPKFAISSS
ncbi:hypothetical protein KGF57_004126 [Candida theae]|uniref:Uncharacterized protein n=1 Tax=Candida theae TaxID=1198502 RepID=A0AAD5BBV6_9ASCO|nr:uncharacterized protein KGF57_004126 [Candida theae]KAI5952920.1 hypothetical protein KGF57_004126 [Candida theae]